MQRISEMALYFVLSQSPTYTTCITQVNSPIFHLYRCVLTSPPATEKFKIDPFVYVDRELSKEVQEDSDDEEEAVARA